MESGLAGRTAVVTGGGRGIGRAIALALSQAGAQVVVADIDAGNAEAVAGEIRSEGRPADAIAVDISDVGDIERAFAAIDALGTGLDIAVLAAGVLRAKPLFDHTEDDWRFMSEVNLKGTFFTLQAAARRMAARGHGVILTLSSTSAFVASRVPEVLYDVTKGGIRQMTVSAAVELAPLGIRVNALAPGTILTDFNRSSLDTPDKIASAESRLPMGRVGTPQDVAGAAVFLCSPAASYMTGHVLAVDGGRLARAG
ncbi:MAG: SDR family oxidoreductase [Rhizobiaceae bacterium]